VRWPRSLDCSGRCRSSKVCEAATSAGLKLLNQLPPLSPAAFSAYLLLFPLHATQRVVQAVHQAEEKSQALADACCDLVVTACELLQVSRHTARLFCTYCWAYSSESCPLLHTHFLRFQIVWRWSNLPILRDNEKTGCIGLNRWGVCTSLAHCRIVSCCPIVITVVVRYMMLKTCVVGVRSGANPR
jgi:hypothetical protein